MTGGRMPDWGGNGAPGSSFVERHAVGYACALLSAFVWATYSLYGQRLRRNGIAYPTAAIGLFCLVSGLLALVCHAVLEAPYRFTTSDLMPLAALAFGPMGAAFFLWDAALVRGDARVIGTLAYLTPLVSTVVLALGQDGTIGWPVVVALPLVTGGAIVGTRSAGERTA